MANEARIGLSLDGDRQVVAGIKAVLKAQQELRDESKKSKQDADASKAAEGFSLQKVAIAGVTAVLGVATRAAIDYGKAVTDMRPINFGQAGDRAKAFEEQIARMAVRGGKSVEDLRTKFKQTGADIGVMPERVANVASALQKVTYSNESGEMVKDLGNEANDTNRSLEEMAELGETLYNKLGVPADKVGEAIGRIKTIATDLKTVGGHIALEDTLVRLGPELARFGGSLQQKTALVAAIGQGKSPMVAQRQAGAIMGAISHADPLLVDKALKEETKDRNYKGWTVDPNTGDAVLKMEALEILQRRFKKAPGGIRALTRLLGNDVGAAQTLWNLDFKKVNAEAAKAAAPPPLDKSTEEMLSGLSPENRTWAAGEVAKVAVANKPVYQSKLMQETAGRRAQVEVERANAEIDKGEKIQQARDEQNALYQGHREAQADVATTSKYLPGAESAAAIFATLKSNVFAVQLKDDVRLASGSIKALAEAVRPPNTGGTSNAVQRALSEAPRTNY